MSDSYDYIPKEIRERIIWKRDKKQDGDPDEIAGFEFSPRPCEDCGLTLEESRTFRISISQSEAHHPHLKHQCQICKKYRNPATGAWDLDFYQLNAIFKRSRKQNDK